MHFPSGSIQNSPSTSKSLELLRPRWPKIQSHIPLLLVRYCLSLFLAAGIVFQSGIVIAHQTPPTPPESELARIEPGLKGSVEFLRVAPSRLRDRCNAQQLEMLDDIRQYLGYVDAIRWAAADQSPQRYSEYYRWKSEEALLKLLPGFQDVIKIDLRTANPRNTGIEALDIDLQHSSVLLHVITGVEGPIEFDVQTWELSQEETPRGREIVVADRGETYVLVQIKGSPAAETINRFPIRKRSDAEPCNWRAVRWKARPWGQLVLDFTDEHGNPTPALLSLLSKRGDLLWPPEGCLDFRPQLDNILIPLFSDPGKGYMFHLPGKRRGRYWIVPVPLRNGNSRRTVGGAYPARP